MACSCKADLKINKGSVPVTYYNTFKLKYINTSISVYKEDYDFSADTQPLQYCNNCIQKHLAMAVAMIEQGSFIETLAAAGLMLLASLHYSSLNKAMAVKCYYLGLLYLQNKTNTVLYLNRLKKLISYTVNPRPVTRWWDNLELPKLSQSTTLWSFKFACLLLICGAYSLLFTLMGYLNVNKAFAVGKLGIVANHLVLMDCQLEATKLRLVWKKAQLMKPHGTIYKEARKELADIMQHLYNKFKQDPGYKDVNR